MFTFLVRNKESSFQISKIFFVFILKPFHSKIKALRGFRAELSNWWVIVLYSDFTCHRKYDILHSLIFVLLNLLKTN